jgi:hypothetical protein
MKISDGDGNQEGASFKDASWSARCGQLAEIIKSGRKLLIFLRDNPDPDSIAAGLILLRIARQLQVRTQIVHGGELARAENRVPPSGVQQRSFWSTSMGVAVNSTQLSPRPPPTR